MSGLHAELLEAAALCGVASLRQIDPAIVVGKPPSGETTP
jgi:hypothetical protein